MAETKVLRLVSDIPGSSSQLAKTWLFIGRLQEAVRGNLLCHAQSHISKLKCSHTLVGHALSHISNVISNL